MPIACCLMKEPKIGPDELPSMVSEWADLAGVAPKDICINLLTDVAQGGPSYEALVTLYLPSLWPDEDVRNIQLGLLKVLLKYLNTTPDRIFIMTSIIQSGHVVENGEILSWKAKP